MEFYGRPREEAERLAGLLERPNRRVWWAPWEPVIAEHHRLFFGLEGFASGVFVYVPSIMPGLLHTPGYASALIPVGQVPPLHHDRIVEFRQVRQQRLLDDEHPLALAVVIDEHALDRNVGGIACLRDPRRVDGLPQRRARRRVRRAHRGTAVENSAWRDRGPREPPVRR